MPGIDVVWLVEQVASDRNYQSRLADLQRRGASDHEVGALLNSVAERLFAAVNSAWTQPGRTAKLTQLRVGLIRMAEKADAAERVGAPGAAAQSNWCWALVGFIESALGGTPESVARMIGH